MDSIQSVKKDVNDKLLTVGNKLTALLSWGPFDRLIFEMMAKNRRPDAVLPGFEVAYKSAVPWAVAVIMLASSLIFESAIIAFSCPFVVGVLLAVRYREISDRLQVISRMPETKTALYNATEWIHRKANGDLAGYDTNLVQPLLVDYFKKRRHLSGSEFFNVYLEIAAACGTVIKDTQSKKEEFAAMFVAQGAAADNITETDLDAATEEDEGSLEILCESHEEDEELVKEAIRYRDSFEVTNAPVNTEEDQTEETDDPARDTEDEVEQAGPITITDNEVGQDGSDEADITDSRDHVDDTQESSSSETANTDEQEEKETDGEEDEVDILDLDDDFDGYNTDQDAELPPDELEKENEPEADLTDDQLEEMMADFKAESLAEKHSD